jgi:hypothetical protein
VKNFIPYHNIFPSVFCGINLSTITSVCPKKCKYVRVYVRMCVCTYVYMYHVCMCVICVCVCNECIYMDVDLYYDLAKRKLYFVASLAHA